MTLRNFFWTSEKRHRIRALARKADRAVAVAAANLALYRARRVAAEAAHKITADRSPEEAVEMQGNSHTERHRCTPAT